MTIQTGTSEKGQKEIRRNWPVVEGLTAGTTKQTGEKKLTPEKKSLVTRREKIGF